MPDHYETLIADANRIAEAAGVVQDSSGRFLAQSVVLMAGINPHSGQAQVMQNNKDPRRMYLDLPDSYTPQEIEQILKTLNGNGAAIAVQTFDENKKAGNNLITLEMDAEAFSHVVKSKKFVDAATETAKTIHEDQVRQIQNEKLAAKDGDLTFSNMDGQVLDKKNLEISSDRFLSAPTVDQLRAHKDMDGNSFDPDTHPIWKHYNDINVAGASADDRMRAYTLALTLTPLGNGEVMMDGRVTERDFERAYRSPDAVVSRAEDILRSNRAYWKAGAIEPGREGSAEDRLIVQSDIIRQADATPPTPAVPATPETVHTPPAQEEAHDIFSGEDPFTATPSTPLHRPSTMANGHPNHAPTVSNAARAFAKACNNQIGAAAIADVWERNAGLQSKYKDKAAYESAVAKDTQCSGARLDCFDKYHAVMQGMVEKSGYSANVEIQGQTRETATLAGVAGIGNLQNKMLDGDKANDLDLDQMRKIIGRLGVKLEGTVHEVKVGYEVTQGGKKTSKEATLGI